MLPWLRLYRRQPDWRATDKRMLELRGGWSRWQFGVLLPRLGFVLWNSEYEPLAAWRWWPT